MQQNEVRLRYITGRILQIKVNEDTWQIRKVGGRFLLFHNNYVFCGRERRLLNDFHEQKVRASLGFDGYAEIMETYKPAFHIDRIIAEEGTMMNKGDTILTLNNPDLIRAIEDQQDEWEKQLISYQAVSYTHLRAHET